MLKRIFILVISFNFYTVGYAQLEPAAYGSGIPISYVRTYDARVPETNASALLSKPVNEVLQTTAYVDGLGRPLQTVVKQGSLLTDGSVSADMVTPFIYDDQGREAYQFLPFAAGTSDGSFKSNPFQQQKTFYQSQLSGQGETYYYNKTNFEASDFNRPVTQYPAGNSWVGSSRGSGITYLNNTSDDDVKIWKVNGAGDYTVTGVYAAGLLTELHTKDEQNNEVVEYTNKTGQVILKKVQAGATPGLSYTGWISTYYVYDDYGNLRLVIQPKAVDWLIANSWTFTTDILNELCFRYEYDDFNRMIIKKVPGAGEVYMVYDIRDRLVMTQDANMRNGTVKWLVTKYDALNRAVETGLWQNSTAFSTHLSNAAVSSSYPSTTGTYDIMTVTHYDDYSNLPVGVYSYLNNWNNSAYFNTNTGTWPYPQMHTASSATKGMVTWTSTRVLGSNTFLHSVRHYDEKARVIQVQSNNYSGDWSLDVTTTQYSWAGLPLTVVNRLFTVGSNSQEHTVTTKMIYDDLGRVSEIKKMVNSYVNSTVVNKGEQTIVKNEYDRLGQLKIKKLAPGYNSNAGLENLLYDYNIRGWMLGMNRPFINNQNSSNYFGFELGYDKTGAAVNGTTYNSALYNGNISGTTWKSKGDNERRKYDFTYDRLNRLLAADFNQYTSGSYNKTANVDFSVKMGNGTDYTTAYDPNGNILKMQQWGLKVSSSTQIDNLSYSYSTSSNSNRLNSVTELSPVGTTDNKLGDFTDKNVSDDDYSYDLNGNLILDKNKTISAVTYNHLNLPALITVTGKGNIAYTYDAAGNKLNKVTTENNASITYNATSYTGVTVITTTSYIGGATYESKSYSNGTLNTALGYTDKMQFIGFEEGKVRTVFENPAATNTVTGFEYDYMIKDHLGNVRMILTEEENTATYAATFETASREVEELLFVNIESTAESILHVADYPRDLTTDPNEYTSKLDGYEKKKGASIALKVMSGDKIDVATNVWYPVPPGGPVTINPNVPENLLEALVATLSNQASALSGGKAGEDILSATGSSVYNGLDDFLTNHTTTTGGPAAYLNWFLLDEQFKYVPEGSGFIQVPAQDADIQTMANTGIEVPKSGYIFIYLSNVTERPVYFDNFIVNHHTGPLMEETHYYPFGLTMAGICSKAAGGLKNKMLFTSQILDNDFGLDLYQMRFRNHDPQIGRFIQVDPLASHYVYNSTYAYAENDVIRSIDLEGLEKLIITHEEVQEGISKVKIDAVRRGKDLLDNNITLKGSDGEDIPITKDILVLQNGMNINHSEGDILQRDVVYPSDKFIMKNGEKTYLKVDGGKTGEVSIVVNGKNEKGGKKIPDVSGEVFSQIGDTKITAEGYMVGMDFGVENQGQAFNSINSLINNLFKTVPSLNKENFLLSLQGLKDNISDLNRLKESLTLMFPKATIIVDKGDVPKKNKINFNATITAVQ
ncbi:MAG: DUF6443 domain-containing protein [Ferruginibacter sp.]